jgi:hypothetical protein
MPFCHAHRECLHKMIDRSCADILPYQSKKYLRLLLGCAGTGLDMSVKSVGRSVIIDHGWIVMGFWKLMGLSPKGSSFSFFVELLGTLRP